jgi:hypothetical protein
VQEGGRSSSTSASHPAAVDALRAKPAAPPDCCHSGESAGRVIHAFDKRRRKSFTVWLLKTCLSTDRTKADSPLLRPEGHCACLGITGRLS